MKNINPTNYTFNEQDIKDYKFTYKHEIDTYFEKKGIKVMYNTLGATEMLMRSFIKDYQHMVDKAHQKHIKFIKHDIYQTMYPIVSRKKLTGFEDLKRWDLKKRTYLNEIVPIRQRIFPLSPIGLSFEFKENKQVERANYKEQLKLHLHKVENPLLYLSGGGDSELVAYALLDSGIKFKVVICKWMLPDGTCSNHDDIKYAFSFCLKENIIPIVKEVNIKEAWNDKLFDEIACGTHTRSPHVATHCYAIELLNEEYPNHTHLFGGEIIWHSSATHEPDKRANRYNIVYYDKIPNVLGHYVANRSTSGGGVTRAEVTDSSLPGKFRVGLYYGSSSFSYPTFYTGPTTSFQFQSSGNYQITCNNCLEVFPTFSTYSTYYWTSAASNLGNVSGASAAGYFGLEVATSSTPGVWAGQGHSLEANNLF